MSSYFGSAREGVSQLLSPNPLCYNAELTEDGKTRHSSTATQGCLPGKTIKLFLFGRGTSCLISKGNRTNRIPRQWTGILCCACFVMSKYRNCKVIFISYKFSPGHCHWTKPNFILSHKESFRKPYHENFTVENVFM